MYKLELNGNQIKSNIYLGTGILDRAAELSLTLEDASLGKNLISPFPSKVLIVVDKHVAPLYLSRLVKSFLNYGLPVVKHVIEPGEQYKTLATATEIFDVLTKEGFGKNDMIVALGGGVIGDLVGFAAVVYLRGMKWLVQIPTTLLAQVDSAVGGKCGIDLPQGKNMVGAIRQPDIVIADREVLATLSEDIFASGMAEVIKYGCIWDSSILGQLKKLNLSISDESDESKVQLEEIIRKCIEIKIKIVEIDETENGLRKLLNFGHTVGHSIEKLGHFKAYSHGEAVAIGMAAAVKLGEQMGITRLGCYEDLIELLNLYHLPTKIKFPMESVYQSMLSDKKKQGDSISYIFIEDFGKARIVELPLQQLKQQLEALNPVCGTNAMEERNG